MNPSPYLVLLATIFSASVAAPAQTSSPCTDLKSLKFEGVEISKSELVPAGTMIPAAYPGAPAIGPLPEHCRVDGVINHRRGIDGQEFGIRVCGSFPPTKSRGTVTS